MVVQLPNLSDLSSDAKNAIIFRLFDDFQQLQRTVKSLQDRVVSLEAENHKLRNENNKLRDENNKLQEEVKELTGKLAKNSTNSSKPPSSDGYKKPKPKSLRKPSGKSPGGQKGHPGTRLERTETPDHTVVHPVSQCQKCGESLGEISRFQQRAKSSSDRMKEMFWDLFSQAGIDRTENSQRDY